MAIHILDGSVLFAAVAAFLFATLGMRQVLARKKVRALRS
jgi:hypothetical protein